MKKITWQLRRYYWQIRSWLPCGWKQKNRFIRDFSHNVKNFVEQHPQTDISAIREHFGTPQEIAAAFVEETDISQLVKSLRTRRRIVRIVLTVAIVCLILYAIVQVCELYIFHDTFGGSFKETFRILQ